jgi:mono/diheme cytochrome c family protein
MKYTILKTFIAVTGIIICMQACSPAGGNDTGHEYMPDMAHSIAYEANVYNDYNLNKWKTESVKDVVELSMPRLPIKGTMPRGFSGYGTNGAYREGALGASMSGQHSIQGIHINPNGFVPYYYADTPEDRLRATAEITKAPFPITKEGLAKGKELYTIYCGVCHGDKGDGQGYLVRDGGKYPAQPANLVNEIFTNSSNGRFYHAIMYGLNVMGGYSDKLDYKERWQVIQYIRSLQAKANKMEYSEKLNTLNSDVPSASIPVVVAPVDEEEAVPTPSEAAPSHGH